VELSDDEFRLRLRAVLARSGRSMRGLSSAMGRDPGYIAALLDPTRPSRARPTPADLLGASDGTGIPLVTLLERLWQIPAARLADELSGLGLTGPGDLGGRGLSETERTSLADYVAFLAARHRPGPRAGGPGRRWARQRVGGEGEDPGQSGAPRDATRRRR
jgi:hypothetical protein